MSRPVISEDFEDKFVKKYTSKRKPNGDFKSEGTAERYLYEVDKFGEWLREEKDKSLLEADGSDFRVHMEELIGDDYSPSYITGRRSAISQFYQIAEEMEEDYDVVSGVPSNPTEDYDENWSTNGGPKSDGVDAEEGIYYLTPEEVQQVEQNVPAPKLRNRLIIRLLMNCGFRRGELAKLKVDNIDRDNNTIYIPPRKSPEERRVPYSEEYVGFLLDKWIDGERDTIYYARHHDSDYLFPTQESEHITGYSINHIVREAAYNAGLNKEINQRADGRPIHKYTAHSLRHSYAVQAIDSGIDVRTLMQLMGHQELDTTLIYLKIDDDTAVEEGRNFKPLG